MLLFSKTQSNSSEENCGSVALTSDWMFGTPFLRWMDKHTDDVVSETPEAGEVLILIFDL